MDIDIVKLSAALFRPEVKMGTYGEIFGKLGFSEHSKASSLWKKLMPAEGLGPAAQGHASSLLDEMVKCPDPDMALLNLSRFADSVISPAQFLNSPLLEKPICHLLIVIFSCSYYLSDILVRNPGYLSWLIERSTLELPKSYSVYLMELKCQIAPFKERCRRINSIKRYRRREILRIGARDLLGLAPVEEVTAELSFLADAVIETVACLSFEEEGTSVLRGPDGDRARAGADRIRWEREGDRPFHRFAVLSLGKLGGTELNYSSDIDILYTCGAGADKSELEFYTSLARRITEDLTSPTEEGTLYRVDLRLRPDGETGPLVVTTDEHLNYMLGRARPWEKQALLKARYTSGNTTVADDFKANCDHVIFNTISDPNPLPGILEMRERAIAHLSAREREGNIKLMSGGIRDIEFIAQALQLTHGRNRTEVRSRNTLEALERLHHYGLLSDDVLESMNRCYRLYRTIEHRLQMLRDVRTHTLPADEDDLSKLGARTSYSALSNITGENFRTEVSRSIRQVQILFGSFFKDQVPGEIPLILSLPPGEREVAELFSNYGIREGESAHRFLSSLVYGDFPKLEGPGTLEAAAASLPTILQSVSSTPDPSLTLRNLVRIIKSSGAVRSTLGLLAAGGDLLRLLLVIASLSTKLTETISNRIELLDLLAEGVHPGEPKDAGRDQKKFLASLARWYEESLLYIHCQKPIPENGPRVLGPLLSEALEKVIKALFTAAGGGETGAALFALGSLGSRQCRFGSDLDLLAVIPDGRDPGAITGVLRDMIKFGRRINIGPMDMRLRGEGGGSPLVQTLERYRGYFKKRAGLWELLAFAGCRFISGNEETGSGFMKILEEHLSAEKFGAGFGAELIAERERLESLSQGTWDVKHAPGGLYDIYFILSSAVLRAAADSRIPPAGLSPSVFNGTIEHLISLGLLEKEDSDKLRGAYRLYYLTEHAAALHGLKYPPLPERESFMEGYMGRLLGRPAAGDGSFTDKLKMMKRTIRDIFSRYTDRLGK